jgi:Domain of unknown function (DU1801)
MADSSNLRPPDPQLPGFIETYESAHFRACAGACARLFSIRRRTQGNVNLGFPQGASLPDPHRVLEGDGKTMRHIKFRSHRDVERPFVPHYIQAAMEQLGCPRESGRLVSVADRRGRACALLRSAFAGTTARRSNYDTT